MPYADISQPAKPLPTADVETIDSNLGLQSPLTRRGGPGPGLILIVPEAAKGAVTHDGVPSPLLKWAEEGYCVAEVTADNHVDKTMSDALEVLEQSTHCEPKDRVGLVGKSYR